MKGAVFFAGAGGTSLGLTQAGIDVTLAVEYWKPAITTHEHNHPDTEHLLEDIGTLDPTTLGRFDVVSGSPPCPEFSTAKGHKADPEKGMILVDAFRRIIEETRPRWWFMENVRRVTKFIDPADYPNVKLLNSADYGIPQTRTRAFCGRYVVPTQTHAEKPYRRLDGIDILPWVSLDEALGWDGTYYRGHTNAAAMNRYRERGGDEPARTVLTDGYYLTPEQIASAYAKKRAMPRVGPVPMGKVMYPEDPTKPARTITATASKGGRESFVLGEEPVDPYPVPDEMIPVIDRNTAKVASRYGIDPKTVAPVLEPLRHRTYRSATPEEVAILMGFPAGYEFLGSKSAIYRQIGNAVCPGVARAIALANLDQSAPEQYPARSTEKDDSRHPGNAGPMVDTDGLEDKDDALRGGG